jgi:hypothetical protein
MHGKKVKEESGEATLLHVAKEMAKPRFAKSAREKDTAHADPRSCAKRLRTGL